MKSISSWTHRIRQSRIAMSLALGLVLTMAATAPVHADNDRGRAAAGHNRGHQVDRDWRGHENHARRDWDGGPEPYAVYAPPVVYSPPAYEEPGINFIIPLHIH